MLVGIPDEILLRAESASAIQQHLDSESFWHKNGTPHAQYQLPDDALPVQQITRTLVMAAGTNLQEILG
jgi:hypothetical protein